MNRKEALEIVSKLDKETKNAIAIIIETADVQGDYIYYDGEGSAWEDNCQQTLDYLAKEIRACGQLM